MEITGLSEPFSWFTPQLVISLLSSLPGFAGLWLNWQTRRELASQSTLQVAFEIEELPQEAGYHSARILLRNPSELPLQIQTIEIIEPKTGFQIGLQEKFLNDTIMSIRHSGSSIEVYFDVPPSASAPVLTEWPTEIKIFCGSTTDRVSQIAVCIRVVYISIADRRRLMKKNAISQKVTFRNMRVKPRMTVPFTDPTPKT